MNKTTPSQLKANQNYRKRISESNDEQKKAHRNYMTAKRNAKSFINTKATLEDLDELVTLIKERKKAVANT